MAGQYINHFTAIRLRITGSGNLISTFFSLDGIKSKVLTSIAMSNTTNKYPTVNTNFNTQQAQLEIKTTEIDETFLIREIIVYAKPVFTSFPQ